MLLFDNIKPQGSREDPYSQNYDMNYNPLEDDRVREKRERCEGYNEEEFIKQSEITINQITKEKNDSSTTDA